MRGDPFGPEDYAETRLSRFSGLLRNRTLQRRLHVRPGSMICSLTAADECI